MPKTAQQLRTGYRTRKNKSAVDAASWKDIEEKKGVGGVFAWKPDKSAIAKQSHSV